MHLDAVGFRYRRSAPWVLDGVTARIEPGDTIVLEGRNGVGKSTLLQLIVGVLEPSRGQVRERPRVVAWVPERFPTEQPFTLSQYLHAVAGLRGLRGSAAASTIGRWTERLGIAGFGRTRLPELSKGTAQKVGLAQALLVPPQLLVLDEPWEGLDAGARELVPTLIAEVLAAGGAAVVSDHRGEAGWLPGAHTWRLDGSGFSTAAAEVDRTWTLEVVLAAAATPGAVALLRGAGHDHIRVRPTETP